jgi:hypothetical protein
LRTQTAQSQVEIGADKSGVHAFCHHRFIRDRLKSLAEEVAGCVWGESGAGFYRTMAHMDDRPAPPAPSRKERKPILVHGSIPTPRPRRRIESALHIDHQQNSALSAGTIRGFIIATHLDLLGDGCLDGLQSDLWL